MTCVYATVYGRVLNDVLGHANFREIAKPSIIVCVVTVNRYGDNNAQPESKSGIVALMSVKN